jgi:hypothetical protein
VGVAYWGRQLELGGRPRGVLTFRVPVIQAGCAMWARRGMVEAVEVRAAQVEGAAVRLRAVLRDMCAVGVGVQQRSR